MPAVGMSWVSITQLVGLSRYSMAAPGSARSTAAGSAPSTKSTVMLEPWQQIQEQSVGVRIDMPDADDAVAGPHVRQHGGTDRRHAAGQPARRLGHFQRGDLGLEFHDRRIVAAAVDRPPHFAGEAALQLGIIGIGEQRGLIDRRNDGAERKVVVMGDDPSPPSACRPAPGGRAQPASASCAARTSSWTMARIASVFCRADSGSPALIASNSSRCSGNERLANSGCPRGLVKKS